MEYRGSDDRVRFELPTVIDPRRVVRSIEVRS